MLKLRFRKLKLRFSDVNVRKGGEGTFFISLSTWIKQTQVSQVLELSFSEQVNKCTRFFFILVLLIWCQ